MLAYCFITVFFIFSGYLIHLFCFKERETTNTQQDLKIFDELDLNYKPIIELEPFDFKTTKAYYFKPGFSLNYAEPMALTLFTDENEHLNFAIHCTDSNKYKVGQIRNLTYEDNKGSDISFQWSYQRFDGYSDTVKVIIYRIKEGDIIKFMCNVFNSDKTRNCYIGLQVTKNEIIATESLIH